MSLKKKMNLLSDIRGAMIFEFFNPGIPIILKNAGCEFIIFDMEHGGLSLQQFKVLSSISSSNNIYPLIRIPEINYNHIARALDLGAAGIMAPMVNTSNDVMKVIKSSKYPPIGVRGAGFGFAHDNYKNDDPVSYIKKVNNELVNIIQIETKSALENIEEIASLKEVDCLWVGHFDLTNFLGIPGDFQSSIYTDAIDRIVQVAKLNHKSLGIMVNNKDEFMFYSNLGFNVIAVGTEMSLLSKAISQILN